MGPEVVVGTAGWSIPGQVRDRFPPAASSLARYSAIFGGVEINSTFYRSHRASTYNRWRDSVPPSFRFAVKVPREISHILRLENTDRALSAFLNETSALGLQRGPLLLQLPPKLPFAEASATTFFSLVRNFFDGPMATEPRHPSWFCAEADELMQIHRIARVGADPPRAPSGFLPGGFRGFTYLRLHGSPRVYFSSYDDAQIKEYADKIKIGSEPTWCIFDNTASGAAAKNALELRDSLAVSG